MSSYEIVETRCVFCNAGLGKYGNMCPDQERHCHYCRKPESRAMDPCINNGEHYFVRGHEFQRVPVKT